MSLFSYAGAGSQVQADYPAYLVKMTTPDTTYAFLLTGAPSYDDGYTSALFGDGVASDVSALLSAVYSHLSGGSWSGESISSVTITKYNETTSNATP